MTVHCPVPVTVHCPAPVLPSSQCLPSPQNLSSPQGPITAIPACGECDAKHPLLGGLFGKHKRTM